MQNIIIKNRKFQENIVNLVNNSGLPAFIMKQTLKDVVTLLEQLEEQQLQEAVREESQEEGEEKAAADQALSSENKKGG